MTSYDEQSASWQEGYDDFYEWESDDSDVDQFANEPAIGEDERGAVAYPMSAHADYHRGWNHADYENAYEGYKLAKGGPDSDG